MDPDRAPQPDFSRLNAAEREALRLLAQGHTAKSIAAATGRTEGAVNERLRDARRKTGVGSSRELARLLRSREDGAGEDRTGDDRESGREIRDEVSGVAGPPQPPPAPAGAPHRACWQGVALMILASGTLAAAALALLSPGWQAAAPPVSPVPPTFGTPDPETVRLYRTYAAETRDPAWADDAEAALWRRFRAIGGADLAAFSVGCRATLCQVRGFARPPAGSPRARDMLTALGSPSLRSAIPGLHADATAVVSGGTGAAYRIDFDGIWRRMPS